MFKVTEFYVQAFIVSPGDDGARCIPIGQVRRTRDEDEARRWAEVERRRLSARCGGGEPEVLVYSVVGEPMFDLWAEPTLRSRHGAGRS